MKRLFTALWFGGVMSLGAVLGVGLAHYQQGKLTHEAEQKGLLAEAPVREVASAEAPAVVTPPAVVEAPKPIPQLPVPRPVQLPVAPPPVVEPPKPPIRVEQAEVPPPKAAPPPLVAPLDAVPAAPAVAVAESHPKPPIAIVISLPSQRAYVFRGGKLWDSTRVSTGKPGKRTPVGTYSILEKAVYHRSNKYSNAPMPYMQRITWGGVALHAGVVPGYPASHGCIRLPSAFAKKLYSITNFSSTVVVTNKALASSKEAHELSNAKPPPPEIDAKTLETVPGMPAAAAPLSPVG